MTKNVFPYGVGGLLNAKRAIEVLKAFEPFQSPYGVGGLLNDTIVSHIYAGFEFQSPYGVGGLLNSGGWNGL